MSELEFLKFLAGLALLLGGAELLVRGASRVASALRISPLVIGLTVVAFGTSSPELAASLTSARSGSGDLAFGNVVGSNLFNVLFILGLAALIVPLSVNRRLVRLDVPVMVTVAAILLLLARDGAISRMEGTGLVLGLCAYLGFLIWQGRRSSVTDSSPRPTETRSLWWAALLALLGLSLLTLGATWLVSAASTVARSLGVSELAIGLTLVAAGTSLPELATSLIAAYRGERDLAVGNVVGSNVFNVLGVLGVTAALSPAGVSVAQSARTFDLPILMAVSLACLPVFFSQLSIDRWEGGLFLLVWLLYSGQLYTASTTSEAASPVSLVVLLLGGVGLLTVFQLRRKS